jgi:hypothetical protein
VAASFFVVGVVEVVFVGEFLSCADVAERADEDVIVVIFGLAVRGAGVIDEHGCTETVNDHVAVAVSEEIGDKSVSIALVSDVLCHAGTVILTDAFTLLDGACCVATGGMNSRGANDEVREHRGLVDLEICGSEADYSKSSDRRSWRLAHTLRRAAQG